MFQPIVPTGGLSGWAFLNATLDRQTDSFNQSPQILRDTDYFLENIHTVSSAEELVSDRRMLRIALGAFGLEDDINNRFFIRKILEDGTEGTDALANRLSDDRYQQLSSAFGFGSQLGSNTALPGFGAQIVSDYRARSFEAAVGDQNASLRIALNANRELSGIASESGSNDTKWFRIMGKPPLRKLFETALGLPSSFAQLDIDRQLETFKERSRAQLNLSSLSDLADANLRETLVQRYLVRDQVANFSAQSANSVALTLLQNAQAQFQPL